MKSDANALQPESEGNAIKERIRNKIKNIYIDSSPEFILSNLLLTEILKHNPEHKKPDLQHWAKDMNDLIRLDKRDPAKIKELILFAQQNEFWFKNVLSPKNLRKHFDRLTLEKQNNGTKGRTTTGATPDDLARTCTEYIIETGQK